MRTLFAQAMTAGLGLAALFAFLSWAFSIVPIPLLGIFGRLSLLFALGALLLLVSAVASFLHHFHLERGWTYLRRYAPLAISLRHDLLDAGYSITRYGPFGEYEQLPRIDLELAEDGKAAVLRIENSVKFDKRLDDVDVSSALKGFVVERTYQSDDRDWYVFELMDASSEFKLRFNTYQEFETYAFDRCDKYHVFLDARTIVPITNALLVGQTGSGKTYALASLILQLRAKGTKLVLCDPKQADVHALSLTLGLGSAAATLDEIADRLESFRDEMQKRKRLMAEKLASRMASTYADFELAPHVLVIDEYAALAYAMRTRDKKFKDEFAARITEIVLQGRQLGFFIYIAMQKSDAALIDTAVRENLPLIVVLGNAQPQTVVTAFGTGADVPPRANGPGEGWFEFPEIAPSPKLVQFPHLRFLSHGHL